jgi:hypothetical protein
MKRRKLKMNHKLTRPNQIITALLAILLGTTNRTTRLDLNEHMRESCVRLRGTYDLESAIP